MNGDERAGERRAPAPRRRRGGGPSARCQPVGLPQRVDRQTRGRASARRRGPSRVERRVREVPRRRARSRGRRRSACPRAARTCAAVSPSRMPPSERPGTSVPARGGQRPPGRRARQQDRERGAPASYARSMPSLWESSRASRVRVDDYSVERRELAVPARVDARDDDGRPRRRRRDRARARTSPTPRPTTTTFPTSEMLAGTWTLDEYSRRVDELELWPPSRRWRRRPTTAAGRSRAPRSTSRCDRRARRSPSARAPVPAGALRRVDARADRARTSSSNPALEFKLDVEKDWDRALMERLAATDRVRVARPEGVLPRHRRRPRARPRALPRGRRGASRTS